MKLNLKITKELLVSFLVMAFLKLSFYLTNKRFRLAFLKTQKFIHTKVDGFLSLKLDLKKIYAFLYIVRMILDTIILHL